MSDEWGPRVEHDGMGCPSFPEGTQLLLRLHGLPELVDLGRGGGSWLWALPGNGLYAKIISYRIRRPRALIQLIDMVESLPVPTGKVEV